MNTHKRIMLLVLAEMARRLFTALVMCLFLLHHGGGGMQCLSGFVSMSTLKQKASLIGSMTSREGQQLIIPWIHFTCSGALTGWNFVAEDRGNGEDREKFPELQIWRPQNPESTLYRKVHGITGFPDTTSYENVYRYTMWGSVHFQAGDVFGVHQPEKRKSRFNLIFQEGGGPINYWQTRENEPLNPFIIDGNDVRSDQNDFPLVGVETTNPECTPRFLDINTLNAKGDLLDGASTDIVERDTELRLFPNVTFGCKGRIDKWIFAAEETGDGEKKPTAQVWRRLLDSDIFIKVQNSTLQPTRTENLNVYEYSPDPPLQFHPGEVLGLHYPTSSESSYRLYNQERAGTTNFRQQNQKSPSIEAFIGYFSSVQTNQRDLPLITVEITVDCGDLENPQNGQVYFTTTTSGSVATYQCNPGYVLEGAQQRVCQETNGEWSGAAPMCKGCGLPSSIIHGSVMLPLFISVGSVVTYSCDVGFVLMGAPSRTCRADGDWSGEEPTCKGIDCGELVYPQNGEVVVTATRPGTNLGSTASYSCNGGYRLVGSEVRVCQENEEWTGVTPICELIDCGEPEAPENGRVSYNSTSLDHTAHYSCSTGYRIMGDHLRTCQENNAWSGVVPTCIAVDCSALSAPAKGSISITKTTFGSEVVYTCEEGFKLVGNITRTCDSNGRWSGVAPICKIIQAPSPTTAGDTDLPKQSPSSYTTEAPTSLSAPEISIFTPFTSHESAQTSSSRSAGLISSPSMGYNPVQTSSTETARTTSIRYEPAQTGRSGLSEPMSSLSEGSYEMLNLVIGAVIGLLVVLILIMVTMIMALYVRRKKLQKETVKLQQKNSFENPVYTGQNIPVSALNCMCRRQCHHIHGQQQPGMVAATPRTGVINNGRQWDPTSHWDQPSRHQHINVPSRSNAPHYEMNPMYHHYEFPDVPHYEMTSNASHYEIPVSPYETPRSTTRGNSRNIYGTLQSGICVPTEAQRRPSAANTLQNLAHDQFFQESETYWKPASDTTSLYEQLARNKYREVLRSQIQITDYLGSGQFGTVKRGLWQSPAGTLEVAVKTLKPGVGEDDRVKFLQEAAINGQFQHPNVVKLQGVVTMGQAVMILLELLENGDLRDYLLKRRPVPGELVPPDWPHLLLSFCKDIASGMQYLSRKAFVHRDLAARNILVAEDRTCKISDFGMSRDLEDENYYISHGGKIPVKWTAPEAVHFKKYSTASDVWSYGTVMYEIWSLGHKPFEEYTNQQTIKLIDRGFRMPPPPGCPRAVYQLMLHSWHPETSSRPTFTDILKFLSQSEADLLRWSEEDARVHPQAAILGAPLEAGKNLYPDLQGTYIIAH